jgi:hypothetical protein
MTAEADEGPLLTQSGHSYSTGGEHDLGHWPGFASGPSTPDL